MRLRRADRCVRCGHEFAPGDEALWYAQARVVTCVECLVEDAGLDVMAGTPGASARREYQRRRQKREDSARRRLGRAGVILARVISEPESTDRWNRGAAGEEFAAKRLEKHLAGTEVRLLHDRRVPGHGRANIDHIAVGPGGITVIDTKKLRGKVRAEKVGGLVSERRTILSVDGRDHTKLVTAVEAQIRYVRAALVGSEDAAVDIAGALCFADVEGLPLIAHQEVQGILIDGPRRVARLAQRPGNLDSVAVERLRQTIGRAFPSA